jgi:hypothetical protein
VSEAGSATTTHTSDIERYMIPALRGPAHTADLRVQPISELSAIIAWRRGAVCDDADR